MEYGDVLEGLTQKQRERFLSLVTENDSIQKQIVELSTLSDKEKKELITKIEQTAATKANTVVTKENTVANEANAKSVGKSKGVLKGFTENIRAAWAAMSGLQKASLVIAAVTTVYSIVSSAINKHNQKLEEVREQAKEAADEANTLGDEIAELTNKYLLLSEAVKTDASAKEDLMTTQTELLKKLGLEGEGIDDLIKKYGSLSNAIKQASLDSLKNAQIDLIAGINEAKKELLDVGSDGFWGDNNIIWADGEDAVEAFKELEKAGIVDSDSYGKSGGGLVLIGDDTTIEGVLENYQTLEDALAVLRDTFTGEELTNNSLYQAIYGRYSEMKEKVENYNGAIANLNENLAQQMMLTALQGQEIPKTEEEFEKFKQELIDSAIASKQFIGSEKDIANAIDSYLSTVPEFEEFYSIPLENEADKLKDFSLSRA